MVWGVTTSTVKAVETRGRPRLRSDDDILRAALLAFAEHGYEGMSLRNLNSELGLSRGTINQRFGSKEQLWYVAINNGFRSVMHEIKAELKRSPTPDDDLGQLREFVRAFLAASARRPELVRLMNHEGLHSTSRLDHIVSEFVLPTFAAPMKVLQRLEAAGIARRVSARMLLFLVAHGAAAPFTLGALSQRFDALEGPFDPAEHVELVTEVIVRGILA
jgi:AcrR family transcriptional regulator